MFDWSIFFYSSSAATIASFVVNRAYEQWKSKNTKRQKLNAYCAVLTDIVQRDLFFISEAADPEELFVSHKELSRNLSTNIAFNEFLELHQLNTLLFLEVTEYYRELGKLKIHLNNLSDDNEDDILIFKIISEKAITAGKHILQLASKG